MPFTMKIQPIDIDSSPSLPKPLLKSRLKRLFDRPFTKNDKSSLTEFEPSSVCLAKMVQNFIEENNEKQAKCGRNRCNCFNGNNDTFSDDDEFDLFGDDASDHLKSLIPCTTVTERNLLADVAKIIEKNKSVKRKDDLRNIVNEGLISLNYNSSICKSKWEKTPSFPAGDYEYIDVTVNEEERIIIDVDFRSEFDIARQTSGYKTLLQSLPFVYVGKFDRLSQIVYLISEAARLSLKKRGMHLPPWRKAEYMRSKWMTSSTKVVAVAEVEVDCVEEIELVFEEKSLSPVLSNNSSSSPKTSRDGGDVAVEREEKVVTGLASLFKDKP